VFIADEAGFDRLFVDRDTLAAKVPEYVEGLETAGLKITNSDAFINACRRNLYMTKKLERIVESGYAASITPERVERLVADFNIDAEVLRDGRLAFDPKKPWALLKVLDEDFLTSPLTDNRYESSSKVQVRT
jgi:hypothetical protein